jgi:uncharacterized protein (TIGR00288 family)
MSAEPLIAVFVDFENLAIGVRDMKSGDFEIRLVLRRLLEKGRIVYKRAYCDWSNYRDAVREFHTQGIELVDIPQSKMSGKNSADIRMVVDALDLCYSKHHIDVFALISGDSDFSPLVSKLKENDKRVIGCGVKSSTSDLLIANCDEFIFYDDLVRKEEARQRQARRRPAARPSGDAAAKKAAPAGDEDRRQEAMDLIMKTVEALLEERGGEEKLWGSMIKQTLKRRNPGFNESFYGFRSFSDLLEAAEAAGLLTIERDEKSGGYICRLPGSPKPPPGTPS